MAARRRTARLSGSTGGGHAADDNGVKHTIRRTLLALGAGVVVQRAAQLVAFVLVGNALGVAGLGVFAQGQAMAAVLVVLAGAGVRNVTARRVANDPAAARALILGAVRRRLGAGLAAATAAAAVAFAVSEQPWFWLLCALQVLPGALDLKHVLDAAGRARAEVGLETAAAVVQLLLVALLCTAGTPGVALLAAAALTGRCVYGAGAVIVLASLGGRTAPASARGPVPRTVIAGETAHHLLACGDVWLVALLLGDAAAGFYAFAVRFAAAALVPSAQLARLLLPHLLHAPERGDARRTLATALRATALATLPMLGGGAVLAADLCSVAAADFARSAPALQLLLVAGCLQHLGWQCSHGLLAGHRDRAYGLGLLLPPLVQAGALGTIALLPAAADGASHAAAAAAVAAQGLYLLAGLAATRALWRGEARRLLGPVAVALATAAAVRSAAELPLPAIARLAAELLAGAGALAAGVWWVELRARWARVGDGLAAASGLRS